MAALTCWSCAREIDVPLPIGRREVCPHCDVDLRCCRMCTHYDTGYARDCREPDADEVVDKERGNLCDFFQPGGAPGAPQKDEAGAARDKLARLFGDDAAEGGRPGESEADAARRKLDELFKKDS